MLGCMFFTTGDLADRAITIRHNLGDTQEDIARIAGVDRRTVITFEQGDMENLSFDTINRIARAVNMEIDIEIEDR